MFFLMGHPRPLSLYFRLFNLYVQLVDKVCRCWDSNRGSLVSEATALPTEPPPLPIHLCVCSNKYNTSFYSSEDLIKDINSLF